MFLENEPDVFISQFWRDFYRSMLTHAARKSLGKLLVIAVSAGVLLLPHSAEAADRPNLVVMVDLTQSVAVKTPDGTTESEKNLQAVTRLLSQVPAGVHVDLTGDFCTRWNERESTWYKNRRSGHVDCSTAKRRRSSTAIWRPRE